MKSYKVIKEFACAKKGDILAYDEETNLYTIDIQDGNKIRYIGMDEQSADSMTEQGYLLCIVEDDYVECDCCEKLEEVSQLVDKLITEYHNSYEATMNLAEEGKIQPCVRVEAETVYFNLTKVLKKIKETINE